MPNESLTEENPYLTTLQDQQTQNTVRLRASASQALDTNPDEMARQKRVADLLGTPVAAVQAMPKEAERAVKMQELEANTAKSPLLKQKYSDVDFAKLAHDDSGSLSTIAEAAKYFFSAPGKSSTLMGDAKALYFGAQSSAAGAFGAVAGTTAYPFDFLEGATSIGGNPLRRLQEGFMSIANQQAADQKKATGTSKTWLGGAVSGGVQSLGQNMMLMPLAFLPGGQPAALAGMASMAGGQSYQKDIAEGVPHWKAALHGVSDAVIEAGTEIGPLKGLVAEMKAGTPLFTSILKNAWAENKGEQVATALQDLNDWAVNGVNKGKTIVDYLKERPEAAAQTAVGVLIGAGGNVSLMQGVQSVVDQAQGVERSAKIAEHHAEVLGAMQKTAEASKLLQRSPDTLRTYMQDLADQGVPQVFVNSAALVEAGVSMQELAQKLPSVASQMEQVETGGDLVIPTGELLTDSIGTTFAQTLIDHARTGADSMSRAEAKVFMQEQGDQLRAEIDQVLQQRDNDAEFKASRDRVQANLLQQLNTVNRFTPKVNEQYATLAANFYAVTAARSGMTVEQFADTYKLGFAGQAGAGAQVLDQSPFGDALAARIAADLPGVRAEYAKLPGTDGGRILNTDEARELSLDYRADRTKSADVHEPASKFVKDLYAAKLAKPTPKGRQPLVLFTAGGTGAGKSTSMAGQKWAQAAEIIYDTNMNTLDSAVQKVEQALAAGRKVGIVYTFRDPVEALTQRALPRAMRMGRTVPLTEHARTHVGASRVMRDLQVRYANNPNVDIRVYDNSRGKGKGQFTTLDAIPEVDENGLTESLYASLTAEHAAGRINDAVFNGTAGPSLRSQVDDGSDQPRNAGEPDSRNPTGRRGVPSDNEPTARQGLDAGKSGKDRGGIPGQQGQAIKQIDTPAFKKWFGDGNLVDDNGRPLVLYHGTNKKFTEFKRSKTGAMGAAVYLGDDRSVAEAYDGDGKGGAFVMEVYARGKYLNNMEWTKYINEHGWTRAEAAATADGWAGVHDTMFESAVAVWNPADIKSATGNNGDFDANNSSILEQPARGQISFGDDITKQASIVSMLKGADLSTFIHEGGHFFLEVQADLAARIQARITQGEQVTDGERSILTDMNQLLDWMGVKGTPEMSALGEWLAMPLDQKRPHHETFARGFEAYAFEGNAPSLDLQKTFQTFRAWLVNVYRALLKSVNASKADIGKALDVELTPEVRSVMDRMLATSDQIAEAEAARDMGPLFKTAEEAGMTADEYRAYHDQGVQATLDAIDQLQAKGLKDMQWLQNARSRKLKELQKQHDALRTEITMQVRAEVMAQPIYRAWTFLTAKSDNQVVPGVTPVEGIDTAQATGKLRTQVLRDMYGTSDDALWRKVSELRMTSDEVGMHPDIVAEIFEYSSGDELVRALTEAEPPKSVIKGMTDQRMLEENGDLATPAGLERAADMAIHNDARVRFVATELAALQKAMSVREKVPGQRNTVDVLARAAKDYASAVIAKLKMRDVRPGQYTAAEVRSAKAAQKAAGDIAQATLHKRNQLINMYAAKSAYAAQEEVKKAIEYFKKFDRVSKSLDPEYQDQIHALLERFDLRQGVTLKALDKRASLVEWVQSQVEQGMEPDIPSELLQEANRKSFKDMTVEEVRGLRDTIKQIEHLGRLKNKLLTAQANRNFAEVVDEIVAGIDLHAGDRQANTRTPNTVLGGKLVSLKNFWAEHIKAATWARIMDGGKDGGPVWEYLIRTANTAGDNEVVMREKATKELAKLVAPVLKEGPMGGKGVYFKDIDRSLNKEARLAIALNMGNASNMQRLLGGEAWTVQQVRPVLDTLTAAEWTFVQAVWDHLESYRPMIAQKEKRVYGKEPDWIEAVPVQTRFGVLRGGYYPVKYDPRASERAESHADAEAAKRMLAGACTSATTRRSFTKGRVEEVNGRPLLLSIDGIYNGVQEVIHDLTWHEWLIDANKLVRNRKIAGAMREKYGPDAHQQFKKWLEDNAEGDRGAQGAGEKALSYIRQGVSVSGLGLNVMSAMMQPLGLTQSIVRIGPKWVGKGIAKALGSPLDTADQIAEKSDFMRTRHMTRLREVAEVKSQVKGRTKVREAVDSSAYFLMMRAQQLVDVPTWWGAYEKALAEGNDEARAVALSDQAVIDAQGGGSTKDLSAIERGGPGMKLFTTFYSFFNTALNLGVQRTMTSDNKAKLAADYLLLYVVPVILVTALKDAMTPGDSGDWDDPEKLLKKLIGEQISFLFGMVVGVREVAGAMQALTGTAQYSTDYSGPAGLRMLADFVKLGKQIHQGEMDDGLRKAIVNTAGELLRLPAAQVNRTITGIQALNDGKTENFGALFTGYQEPR